MSASSDLHIAVLDLLAVGIPTSVPVLRVRPKELAAAISEAVASKGACVHVLPPLPTRAMQGVPFVFFEGAEIRVRVLEYPELNRTGLDAYEIADAIALSLHWKKPDMCAHPIQLAERPVDMVEDQEKRILDVIFGVQYQINAE